jgi:hypothetical protein
MTVGEVVAMLYYADGVRRTWLWCLVPFPAVATSVKFQG